jgi:hypothetical protein
MARIEITEDALVVLIEGADKLWSLKSRLEVPLEHVAAVEPATERIKAWMGLKVGVHVPGVIAAGSFRQEGQTVFWDVHHPDKAIEVELHDERYNRLVVEVEDRDADMAAIRQALGRPAAGTK